MKQLNPEYQCAIDLVIDVIGGKWKVLILWNLNEGVKRFNELKRSLPNITQKMLTQQLRELEEHGLVERKVYQEVPPKVEYSTTEMGKKLQATLFEMCKWGDEYAEQKGIGMNRCWTTYDFMENDQ
ncbi:winged helix-turn-helix transcriptional regulator [Rossellomorea vietnamensis]|jgi:DNA-binding HxlR family transcriptional regulator|uniref:winged helix-turn-helix transcriptional regulator n=1 Tax=Rossellomorea vietnamensis TaxID=218284 RepID=UPI001E3FEC0A|nr:helix-turn-helix domain-containing protein [Rossellomorea vietnamensis]MCC5802017.1 helix-turn-helix transcriptional regulator [Rossellomorea vietnamensis]